MKNFCPENLSNTIKVFFSGVYICTVLSCLFFTASAAADDRFLPAEYGKIIYRLNSDSPRQLIIVGNSHRDATNRLNQSNTVLTQMDIFHIGEWLNRNWGLDLLLPEGYFGTGDCDPTGSRSDSAGKTDYALLFNRLSDESRFVNAEMLLMEELGMRAVQVEDKNVYDAVWVCLDEITKERGSSPLIEAKLFELRYLQELRTARLLQSIPPAIESELLDGSIRKQAALLTIGLNHIRDIIRYLEKNMITVYPPPTDGDKMKAYAAEPELLRKEYGITIIIPRTLANDRDLMQTVNLDRFFTEGMASVRN